MQEQKMTEAGPTFVSRDYGDRTVPDDAFVLVDGDEEDTSVYMWPDSDSPEDVDGAWLQQGYDLIHIDSDGLRALYASVRVQEKPHDD